MQHIPEAIVLQSCRKNTSMQKEPETARLAVLKIHEIHPQHYFILLISALGKQLQQPEERL